MVDMVWVQGHATGEPGTMGAGRPGTTRRHLEGMRIDYLSQGGNAQIAVVSGVRVQGYNCPVVRMYVAANNAAAGGQRSYTVTAAQGNGQTCDPNALEDVAYAMIQQG